MNTKKIKIRKIISVFSVLFVLILAFSFCVYYYLSSKQPSNLYNSETPSANYSYLDIETKDGGYYAIQGNIRFDKVQNTVTVTEPVLIGYTLPKNQGGAVWVMNREDGEQTLNDLYELREELQNSNDKNIKNKVEDAIERIENSGPYTDSST